MADKHPLTAYTEGESERYDGAGRLRRAKGNRISSPTSVGPVALPNAATLASFGNDFIGVYEDGDPRAPARHAVFEPGPAEPVEREARAGRLRRGGRRRGDPISRGRLVGTAARESGDANLVAESVRPDMCELLAPT
jgi:hypothetical protein